MVRCTSRQVGIIEFCILGRFSFKPVDWIVMYMTDKLHKLCSTCKVVEVFGFLLLPQRGVRPNPPEDINKTERFSLLPSRSVALYDFTPSVFIRTRIIYKTIIVLPKTTIELRELHDMNQIPS